MSTYVTALFADRHSLHAAVEQLVQSGFTRDAISVLMSESTHEREFGRSSAERLARRSIRRSRVFRGLVSSLARLPLLGSGIVLWGVGSLVGTIRRAAEREELSAMEATFAASGLHEREARFVSGGLRDGLLAVCVHTAEERRRLAAQLLELSGGEALQAA
jgi:hypothetical protein